MEVEEEEEEEEKREKMDKGKASVNGKSVSISYIKENGNETRKQAGRAAVIVVASLRSWA
jgi:hypothetical protein